jgi:hypothetical protein
MSNVFRKRGFSAHKKEQERREKEKESRTGKLWRFFMKDGEEDIPLRFLTEEPILFYEHTGKGADGKYFNETCDGEDCSHCASGDKPTYRGAWLVVDGREVEIDEKKDGKPTGKKKVLTDQVRLYVRGSTDIAKLDRLSRKWGLTTRPWFATKTGQNTSTSYELDRGEPSELSEKEIKNLLSKIPETMRDHYTGDDEELYDIVEYNIFDDIELSGDGGSKSSNVSDDDDDEDIDEGVESVEEKKPKKALKIGGKKKSKSVFKRK